jgi:signal peptidase I
MSVTARRSLRERLRGPWRVAMIEGSMLPGIAPGDWLVVDPTVSRWPRVGSVVVFHEPESGELAVKRVGARPGDRVRFAGGYLVLGPDEAWLVADATPGIAGEAGFGPPIDSNRFGPVPIGLLVGRVLFRYGPPGRMGRISSAGDPNARS